jgi:dihydroorotate dehydrogenase
MYEQIISLRNKVNRFGYQRILKPCLFLINPETTHDIMTFVGKIMGSNILTRNLLKISFSYNNRALNQRILEIRFKNPIGLSAGFDKDADLVKTVPNIGFGYETVGSITGEKCEGNPRPRLWRLKKSKGILVYYGLKNPGCENIFKKLKNKKLSIPIGISIAKTNSKNTIKTEAGIKDYLKAFKVLKDIGSYNEINISCPNAYGGEPFIDPKKLDALLEEIDKVKSKKPNFIKLASDLTKDELDKIIDISKEHNIQGFVSTNLTKDRNNKEIHEKNIPITGGISGKPVQKLSTEQIGYIYKKTRGRYLIIGVGGVFNSQDAYEKIKEGASLVSLISGMIFEGPQVISEINQGLVRLLKQDGHKNISDAIGINYR